MDSASQLCDGCFRTLNEIAAWSGMDDGSKRLVWQRLAQRASDAKSDLTSGTKSVAMAGAKSDDQPRPKSAAAPGSGA